MSEKTIPEQLADDMWKIIRRGKRRGLDGWLHDKWVWYHIAYDNYRRGIADGIHHGRIASFLHGAKTVVWFIMPDMLKW